MDDNKNHQLVTDLTALNSDLSRPKVSEGLTVVNEKGKKAVHLIRNENSPGPTHWPHFEVFKKEQSHPAIPGLLMLAPPPHVTDLLTPNQFPRLSAAGTPTILWAVPSPVQNPSPQHTEERENQLTRYLKPTAEPRSADGERGFCGSLQEKAGSGPQQFDTWCLFVFSFQNPSHQCRGPWKILFSGWLHTLSKHEDLTKEGIPGSSISHHRHRPIRDSIVLRDLSQDAENNGDEREPNPLPSLCIHWQDEQDLILFRTQNEIFNRTIRKETHTISDDYGHRSLL